MGNERESNIELLRIVSMAMVLALHACYISTGFPDAAEMAGDKVATMTKVGIEALCIPAVNIFVLISGWFGIRPRVRNVSSFLFQVGYFYLGVSAVMLIGGLITQAGMVESLTNYRSIYWFVVKYAGLLIIAPLLNRYIVNSSTKRLAWTVVSFYLLQTLLWATEWKWISCGYSTTSFAGLYLLASLMRRIKERIPHWAPVWIFAASLTVNIVIGCHTLTKETALAYFLAYSSPLVVLQAASVLLIFAGIRMRSNYAINTIAKSVFAVYLLSEHVFLYARYHSMVLTEYETHNGIAAIVAIGGIVTLWFMAGLILDIPRRTIWHYLTRFRLRLRKPTTI